MIDFAGIRDDWRTSDQHPNPGSRTTGTSLGDARPDNPEYKPKYWSIHWGGGGPYRQGDQGEVDSLLQRWWQYHTSAAHSSGGMSDIAYNYAAPPADGISTYSMRLRGERSNGAQKKSDIYGPLTRTFVFYTGKGGPDFPTPNQLEAFAKLWRQDPLPVRYHSDFPDQFTTCPGDRLIRWIEEEGWWDYLPTVIRVAGVDRYDTAARVATFDWQPNDIAVVNGQAIDGVVAAAKARTVLLTDQATLPAFTGNALAGHTGRVIIVGGEPVVSSAVEDRIRSIVGA